MNLPSLLLQVCCAPDATVAYERLREDYDVTFWWYNPNIHPLAEYEKRLASLIELARIWSVPLIIEKYDPERFFRSVQGLENEPEGGKRCTLCFEMHLTFACERSEKWGFEFVTTTLTTSPHKDTDLINSLGKKIFENSKVQFLPENFKKKDGFLRSVELSKKFKLYRQNYCGCIFSLIPRYRR